MRKLIFVLVGFVWIGAVVKVLADAPDTEGKNWKAEWITAEGVAQRDEVVLHFRKVIELAATPEHFLVDVSADNQFVFYVNGKRVGTGPSRGDLAHWRYETFDLGPFLLAGKNVLGATVRNFGVHAAVAQMTNRTGFLVHGKSKAERAADTDASWEVEEEKGIATMRPEAGEFYFAAGPGERWDAAKIDWDWDHDGTTGGWAKAVTLGHGAMREERDAPNNWQLVADPLPAMEMKEVSSGRVVRAIGVAMPEEFPAKGFEVAARTKASILMDRAELVTAYPALTVSAGAGSKIRVTYSEALYDEKGEKGNRDEIAGKHIVGISDEFLPCGRKNSEFLPLAWRTWRYLQIDVETGDQPIKIEGLQTWFTAYPFEEKGYLGDWVENGAAGCARYVYGHAVLGATAIHRRHADPGADFVHGGGGRSIGTAGDGRVQRFPRTGWIDAEPLSVGAGADDPDVFVAVGRDGTRFLDVSRRCGLCAQGIGGHADGAGLVCAAAAAGWFAGKDCVVAVCGLGEGF
jgi:hypothetical protein